MRTRQAANSEATTSNPDPSLRTSTGPIRIAVALTLIILVTLAQPRPLAGQMVPLTVRPVELTGLAARCGDSTLARDPVIDRISRILSAPDPSADEGRALEEMEAEARRETLASPTDVAAAYRLAAILGARTDLARGRDQLALADELHRRTLRILELDPTHPGAHHILGRLHAAVMRIGGFQRFLAKHLLGSDVLGEASWDRALRHLEAAEAGAPCVPDHHYELGRLHADRGDRSAALEEMGHVLGLTTRDRRRWATVRRKAEALADGE